MMNDFFDGDENDFDYQVNLRIEDIHLLHYCVLKELKPGKVPHPDIQRNRNIFGI